MRKLKFVLFAVVAGLIAILGAAAYGLAGSSDENLKATSRYIAARYKFVEESMQALPSGERYMNTFLVAIQHECGGVLRESPVRRLTPRDEERRTGNQLFLLAVDALSGLEAAQLQPRHRAGEYFVATVARLSWTNGKVTRLVDAAARVEAIRSHLAPARICHDMKVWVASGYRRLPTLSSLTDRDSMVLAVGGGLATPREVSLGALKQYENGAMRSRTAKLELYEGRFNAAELKRAEPYAARLLGIVGIRNLSIGVMRTQTAVTAPHWMRRRLERRCAQHCRYRRR
jgi:hypothetical protein